MRKFTLAACAAGILATVAIGLAGPAAATVPPAPLCSVHVNYQGSDVNVQWC